MAVPGPFYQYFIRIPGSASQGSPEAANGLRRLRLHRSRPTYPPGCALSAVRQASRARSPSPRSTSPAPAVQGQVRGLSGPVYRLQRHPPVSHIGPPTERLSGRPPLGGCKLRAQRTGAANWEQSDHPEEVDGAVAGGEERAARSLGQSQSTSQEVPVPRPRIAMRRIRELLRVAVGQGLSRRRAAAGLGARIDPQAPSGGPETGRPQAPVPKALPRGPHRHAPLIGSVERRDSKVRRVVEPGRRG
jgi:hypothetical protein